jgi:hypothetical protein
MRRVFVYLAFVILLTLSLGAGWLAANWPRQCQALGWCDGRGLL